MRQYIDTLQDVQGNALVGATVLVQNYVGGGNASIFSDNGLTPITTSTVTTGSDGQFSFFAADGDYNLVMSKNSTVFKTQSPVTLFDGTPQLTFNDSGTANAYATSSSVMEKALRPGLRTSFLAANTSTGASTYAYNGLAAKTIVNPGGVAVAAGQIVAQGIYSVEYDGNNWQLRNAGAVIPTYAVTAAETAAFVTPTNLNYPPGTPERYGAVGNGTTDDTTALQNCFNANNVYTLTQNKIYAVQTLVIPATVSPKFYGNGAALLGISTTAQPCVLQILCLYGTFYDLKTATANGSTIPNNNYACSVLLGNATGNCQWNNFYHTFLTSTTRGFVVGCQPTAYTVTGITMAASAVVTLSTSSTSNPFTVGANIKLAGVAGMTQINGVQGSVTAIGGSSGAWTVTTNINSSAYSAYTSGGTAVQSAAGLISENAFFGFGSIGTENPFCMNCTEGFAHFSEPVFYSGHESWNGVSPNYTTARALEIPAGAIFSQGGELEIPNSATGYAADLQSCHLVGMYMETANPLHIIGDAVEITGGVLYNLSSTVPAITVAATAGGAAGAAPNTLLLNGLRFLRQAGTGAFAQVSMIDASAVTGTYQIILDGSQSTEWNWLTVGANVPLIKKPSSAAVNVSVKYRAHVLSQTNSDPNVYTLTEPGDSLYDGYGIVSGGTTFLPFDRMGYTTNGWVLNLVVGGGTTMTATTNTGPTGYNAAQITLAATGNYSTVGKTNGTSQANVQATAQKCAPGDLFWASAWMNPTSGGNAKLILRWFNLAGTELTQTVIADSGSITAAAWNFVEGPSGSAPSGAAYVDAAVWAATTTVEVTDLRLRRAN